MTRTKAFDVGSYSPHFICALSIKLHIAILNILTCLLRCGRGVLRGAAFRQRPLSRLLINVLAGTRTLPPEEPVPKVFYESWRICKSFCPHPSRTCGECASHLCIMEQLPLAIVGFEFAARSTTPGEGNDNVFLDSFVEDWLKKGLEKIRKVWYHKV